MKVIITGSLTFKNYDVLTEKCDFYLQNQKEIEVVTGDLPGSCSLGKKYALSRGYRIAPFPADWKKYGKAAVYIRNEEMAKYADALIAFWDGISKGTGQMINLAKKYNLKIKIYEHINTDNGKTPGAGFSSKGFDPTKEELWADDRFFGWKKRRHDSGETPGY
jgi:hypothetical protein